MWRRDERRPRKGALNIRKFQSGRQHCRISAAIYIMHDGLVESRPPAVLSRLCGLPNCWLRVGHRVKLAFGGARLVRSQRNGATPWFTQLVQPANVSKRPCTDVRQSGQSPPPAPCWMRSPHGTQKAWCLQGSKAQPMGRSKQILQRGIS